MGIKRKKKEKTEDIQLGLFSLKNEICKTIPNDRFYLLTFSSLYDKMMTAHDLILERY